MEPFVLQNESISTIEGWTRQYSGLIAGFTTKNGGISKGYFEKLNLGFHVGDDLHDVCSNRMKVAELIDFPLNRWVGAEQTHNVMIRKVTKEDAGKGAGSYDYSFKGTDGFYTDEEGILLTLCFADCVPLFFIAPEKHMIGTAHAGWKGSVNEIAGHMVKAWGAAGIDPGQIFVTIGPSICGKCYLVDDFIINIVENTLEDAAKKTYNLVSDGQYSLDLPEVNRQVLKKAGVPEKNISRSRFCSSCDLDLFFSHRRDQGRTGRMLSFIGWKEAAERL
jgi:YfiH family protein